MKKYLPLLILLFLLIVIGLTYFLTQKSQEIRQKAAPTTIVSFSPPSLNVLPNTIFNLNSTISSGANLIAGIELNIKFNPSFLRLNSVTLPTTPFIPNMVGTPQINNTLGTARVILLSDPAVPKSGNGTLVVLNFTSLQLGSLQVSYDNATTKASAVNEQSNVNVITTYEIAQVNIANANVSPTPLPITQVRIEPTFINTTVGKTINLSSLAYAGSQPRFNGVTYTWGISSTNSIGTLKYNNDLAEFRATNAGSGDIWVRATDQANNITLTKSIAANVIGPSPSPIIIYPTPTPSPNSITWNTTDVSLQADDFYIIADGVRYLANVQNVRVNSDPQNFPQINYTTLEVSWLENNREMRLYMYFWKDGSNWWSSEIRTYNGQVSGNWIFYTNQKPYFNTPLNQTFTGNIILLSDANNQYGGSIYFKNLRLKAFNRVFPTLTPTPSATPVATPQLASLIANIRFEGVSAQRANQTVKITLKQNGTTRYSQNIVMSSDSSGIYSNATNPLINLLPGIYDIFIKGPVHLTKKFSSKQLSIGDNALVFTANDQMLLAGDGVADNTCNVYDYGNLIDNYKCGSVPPPADKTCTSLVSDYDFNGVIDIFDYNYMIGNFGITGDL